MEKENLMEYVEILLDRALALEYNSGKLTGYETWITVRAVKETFPKLTDEEAQTVADEFNHRIEAASLENAANQYAKDGVTAEEVQSVEPQLNNNNHEIVKEDQEEQK